MSGRKTCSWQRKLTTSNSNGRLYEEQTHFIGLRGGSHDFQSALARTAADTGTEGNGTRGQSAHYQGRKTRSQRYLRCGVSLTRYLKRENYVFEGIEYEQ